MEKVKKADRMLEREQKIIQNKFTGLGQLLILESSFKSICEKEFAKTDISVQHYNNESKF